MPITIAACQSPDETFAALVPVFHYFGRTPDPQTGERFLPFFEDGRAFLARESGQVVGGCGSFAFEMTTPGGVVKTAGLSVVGVLPTHRRRGILRAMMRAQLDDTRRRGEPVAALWASEDTIYGQFGYGLASLSAEMDLPKGSRAFAEPFTPRGRCEILPEVAAAGPLAEVYDRIRRAHPGMMSRSAAWWKHRRLVDPENRRQGAGELNRVLLTLDGRPAGYALYRITQSFDAGVSTGHLAVIEAAGDGFEATRELWRFLLDVDWVDRVKASILPLDHPLIFLLGRPREMKLRVHDGLWVRLVDLPAALAARRLGSADPVVFDVADAFCDWNAGRWSVSPKGAARSDAAPEIACDITALGSVYLGGFTFRQLARAGRVRELVPGAIARADALFPADGAPWCVEVF